MPYSGRKVNNFSFNHADQTDRPSFPSSGALKTAFDSRSEAMRVALNGLIDDLMSIVAGSSGAKNLGATAIPGLTGTDVQALLESLRDTLKSVANGSSGADFVSSAAIAGVGGASVYAQMVSLKALIDAVFTKVQLQATTSGTSGAELIGSAPISGVTGATPYAQLANLKTQLDGLVAGTVPDRSITPIKLSFDPSPFGATTGAANIYAVTLNPAPAAYVDGMALSVKINVDATAASTLNVNGLGVKSLKKANGTDVTNLKANGVYTFRYNSTTGNFILQGEGGSGNAAAGDLRAGKTADTDVGPIVGALAERQGNTAGLAVDGTSTVGRIYIRPAAGIFDGVDDNTFFDDPDFIASNILNTVNIYGLQGALVPGRRSATGTVVSVTGGNYWYASGAGQFTSAYKVEGTGLAFKPSVIILFSTGGSNFLIVYTEQTDNLGYAKTVKVMNYNTANNTGITTYNFKGDVALAGANVAVVALGSFSLPTSGGPSVTHNYLAIE